MSDTTPLRRYVVFGSFDQSTYRDNTGGYRQYGYRIVQIEAYDATDAVVQAGYALGSRMVCDENDKLKPDNHISGIEAWQEQIHGPWSPYPSKAR